MKLKEEEEKSRIKLLKLVQDSDTTKILTDENLKKSLNDLMKYELIDIKNEKIYITERGKRAQREGLNAVIADLGEPPQLTIKKIRVSQYKYNTYLKNIGLLVLVLLFFFGIFFLFLKQ